MGSQTQWTIVWVNSGSWWWTGKPGVLQFIGLQRVGHNWANELNWTELIIKCIILKPISLYFENLLTVIFYITLTQLKWLIHWYISFTLFCNPLGDGTPVYFFPLCPLFFPNRAFGFSPLTSLCSVVYSLFSELNGFFSLIFKFKSNKYFITHITHHILHKIFFLSSEYYINEIVYVRYTA